MLGQEVGHSVIYKLCRVPRLAVLGWMKELYQMLPQTTAWIAVVISCGVIGSWSLLIWEFAQFSNAVATACGRNSKPNAFKLHGNICLADSHPFNHPFCITTCLPASYPHQFIVACFVLCFVWAALISTCLFQMKRWVHELWKLCSYHTKIS